MEKVGDLHLEVGQLAEMKTFDQGFRGAWFRCKIKDVFLEKNQILLEYYDFEDEEISSAKIYEVPHYGRKSNQIKKQLMLRPHYPLICHKNEMPPVNSISELCVIIDGTWKVGDLVDWFEDSCYWTAMVIKVLSDDKVQIELPMSPAGEGGTHEAFCKDLRPSLNWSAENGWTLATMDGHSSSSAQLLFPSQQDCMDYEREDASSTSRISAAIEGDRGRQDEANKMNSEQLKMGAAISSSSSSSSEDNISTLHVEESNEEAVLHVEESNEEAVLHVEESNEEAVLHVEESNEDAVLHVEESNEEAVLHVEESNEVVLHVEGSNEEVVLHAEESNEVVDDLAEYSSVELNMMHEETIEATISDLEELANRIKWIKSILETNQDETPSSPWQFT